MRRLRYLLCCLLVFTFAGCAFPSVPSCNPKKDSYDGMQERGWTLACILTEYDTEYEGNVFYCSQYEDISNGGGMVSPHLPIGQEYSLEIVRSNGPARTTNYFTLVYDKEKIEILPCDEEAQTFYKLKALQECDKEPVTVEYRKTEDGEVEQSFTFYMNFT